MEDEMIQGTVCVLLPELDWLFCECKSILYINESERVWGLFILLFSGYLQEILL